MALWHFTMLTLATSVLSQRPFFAGNVYQQTVVNVTRTISDDVLGNKANAGEIITTTQQPLPLEALGDRTLFNRLRKLPIDRQPFWLLNWQALEANRRNPQTYSQRPSHFGQPLNPSPNSRNENSNFAGTPTIPVSIGSDTVSTGLNIASTPNASPSFPIPSTNIPNINLSSTLGSGNGGLSGTNFENINGFATRGIEISNNASDNRNNSTNLSFPLGNGNDGSVILSSKNINAFENPANELKNTPNGFANPGTRISNNAPDNKNENTNPSNGNRGLANPQNGFTSPGIGISNNAPDNKNQNTNPSNGNRGLANPQNGFANPGIGISNSAPGNKNENANPSSPLDNRNRGSAIIYENNLTKSANEFAISKNSFANPGIGISNSAPGNRNDNANPSSSLGNRNRGSAIISSTEADGFASPASVFTNTENRSNNSANVISNSAPDNINVNRNLNSPLGNRQESPMSTHFEQGDLFTNSANGKFNNVPGNRNISTKPSFLLGSRSESPADLDSTKTSGLANPTNVISNTAPGNTNPNISLDNNKNVDPTNKNSANTNIFINPAKGKPSYEIGKKNEAEMHQFSQPNDSSEEYEFDEASDSGENHRFWSYY